MNWYLVAAFLYLALPLLIVGWIIFRQEINKAKSKPDRSLWLEFGSGGGSSECECGGYIHCTIGGKKVISLRCKCARCKRPYDHKRVEYK